jgi:putative membrane protein
MLLPHISPIHLSGDLSSISRIWICLFALLFERFNHCQVAISTRRLGRSNYLSLAEIRDSNGPFVECSGIEIKEIRKMESINVRRLFAGSIVLTLAMGVSAFTFAQDASQSSGASSNTAGQSSTDQSSTTAKKKHGSADMDKTSASEASAKSGAGDKQFVMKAAEGGMAEVELGQLAASKGSNDAVKQFGQKMADDHGKANDELKSLAQQKGITVPTDLNAKDKAEKARLDKLSGAEFDKAYMEHMVKDHKKDVAEFKKESNSGKDSDVKQWAGKTLPTLESHLQLAQDTASKVGAPSAKSASKKKSGESTSAQQ